MTKKKTLGAVFAVLACYLAFVVVAVIVDTKDSGKSSQNGSAAEGIGRAKTVRHYPGEE